MKETLIKERSEEKEMFFELITKAKTEVYVIKNQVS